MKINLSPHLQSVCLHVEIGVAGFLQELMIGLEGSI